MAPVSLGERLQCVRKRRGLTQGDLAKLSGLSLSLVRKLEQGDRPDTRLETLRKLAVALRVPTSALVVRGDPDGADPETVDRWEPVRRALLGQVKDGPEEPPTAEGVERAMEAVKPALATNRYAEVGTALPMLIRDANALKGEGRQVRSRVLNMTGWALTQTRQFETAEMSLGMAIDAGTDQLDTAAAVNTMCWLFLRQGRLEDARSLGTRWADEIEPARFSRGSVGQLSLWGRLLLAITNAAVRDNRPGEAEDALRLARAAAERVGREVVSDSSTTRTFGPVTVTYICAENYGIMEKPQKVLALAAQVPTVSLHPTSASRLRHRLDVANAHVMVREYGDAFGVLQEIRGIAPEWIVNQRYARDVLKRIIERRRTLTAEMRSLADFIRLEY